MGKASVLIVIGAILSGSIMLFNMQHSSQKTAEVQGRFQRGLLAREMARSAQELALSRIQVDEQGGGKPTIDFEEMSSTAYGGGWIEAQVIPGETNSYKVSFWTEGRFEGFECTDGKDESATVHRIYSVYKPRPGFSSIAPFFGSGYPLNVTADPGAKINPDNDQRVYVDYQRIKELEAFLEKLEDDISDQEDSFVFDSDFEAEDQKSAIEDELKRLAQMNKNDVVFAEDFEKVLGAAFEKKNPGVLAKGETFGLDWFYNKAMDRLNVGDGQAVEGQLQTRTIDEGGSTTEVSQHVSLLSGDLQDELGYSGSIGSLENPQVVHFTADSTVLKGGTTLRGTGVLVAEGDFVVEEGALLDWRGAFIARKQPTPEMTIDFAGEAKIKGTMLVKQDAQEPGGHMDVTVWKDETGAWQEPEGRTCSWWGSCGYRGAYGWWKHSHKYDETFGTNELLFYSDTRSGEVNGGSWWSPSLKDATRFEELLGDYSPGEEFYLRFGPDDQGALLNHGASKFTLQIDGERIEGYASAGFDGEGTFQSRTFTPAELEEFWVEVGTKMRLAPAWDHPDYDYGAPTPGHLQDDCSVSAPTCYDADGDGDGDPIVGGPPYVTSFSHRLAALRIQLWKVGGAGEADKKIYEASPYWHKRNDEEEEENEELQEVAEQMSSDFGTDLHFGSDTSIQTDPKAMRVIGKWLNPRNVSPFVHRQTKEQHWSAHASNHVYAGPRPCTKAGGDG